MSYDPTQRVPPPQQPGYTQYPPPQNYPPQPEYTPNYAPPVPPAPATYQQYAAPPPVGAPGAGFDFAKFWNSLQHSGQACVLGGLILFISLFFSWFSVNVSSSCSGSSECSFFSSEVNQGYYSEAPSASGFSIANGGVTFHSTSVDSNTAGNISESYSFPLLWLVILASLALIALPILVGQRKIAEKQGQLFILISAGLALLMEIIYISGASGAFSQARSNINAFNSAIQSSVGGAGGSIQASASLSTGVDIGFWLALLATLAAGGLYAYFTFFKKAGGAGYPGYPAYQPPAAYPGSQPDPYQSSGAYPGSQPGGYPPPSAYPGSQPSAYPPPYPGSQPYPPQQGQYPGQPPYPGQ